MKQGKSVFKAGKLLKVSAEFDEGEKVLERVSITGDFFLHPEEKLEGLQTALQGAKLEREALRNKIQSFIDKEGVQVFGFDAEQLATAIMEACKRGMQPL